MATKKRKGLGRGLDALLGPVTLDDDQTVAGTPMLMYLDDLCAGAWQPRTRMDEGALYELAESIKSQGIMQPLLVRKANKAVAAQSSATHEIIAGERRWRAALLAGLEQVPVLVRDVGDEAAAAMALIENIQREDLNPLEEAQGVQRLIDEFGLTHEEVAQAIGRSRSATTNLLRLTQLTTPVQTMLMAGDIDMGHARALLTLDGAAQINAANQVASRKLSVRQAEALVRKLNAEFNLKSQRKSRAAEKSGDLRRVEEELSDLLAAEVEVRIKKRSRGEQTGELAIHFGSLETLNGLIDRLRQT